MPTPRFLFGIGVLELALVLTGNRWVPWLGDQAGWVVGAVRKLPE